MRPSDWLLLFLASGSGAWLDPVRIQKGMFLLAMREVIPPAEAYRFEPYAYGPMSRALYRDVRALRRDELIEGARVAGASWELLRASADGAVRAGDLASSVAPKAAHPIARVRAEVEGLSFADLLEAVYDEYPEFAVRSVFRRRPR